MKRREENQSTNKVSCDREAVIAFDYSRLSPSFSKLAKPAQRALINNQIYDEKDLARHTRRVVASLHGIGPSAFPILENALKNAGRKFKD
jgi:hypothetical protein